LDISRVLRGRERVVNQRKFDRDGNYGRRKVVSGQVGKMDKAESIEFAS
jgi:hypothetical protein